MNSNLEKLYKSSDHVVVYDGRVKGTFTDTEYRILLNEGTNRVYESKIDSFSHTSSFKVDIQSFLGLVISRIDKMRFSLPYTPSSYVSIGMSKPKYLGMWDGPFVSVEYYPSPDRYGKRNVMQATYHSKGNRSSAGDIITIDLNKLTDFLVANKDYFKNT